MNYAPVLIPTLNRIEHLSRCIESLIQNSLFECTDIYVSVDFPPAEKYEAGYKKVKLYVTQLISNFNNIHAFFQKKNLGAYKNCYFLIDFIVNKYDRYIITEDDNIFSKNYLEYINWGLDNFKENEDVVAICGYSQNIDWKDYEKSVFLTKKDFNAWGYGTWIKKMAMVDNYITEGELEKKLHMPMTLVKLFVNRPDIFYYAFQYLKKKKPVMINDGKLASIDITRSMYLILNKKYVLMPVVTKVNNIGYDGSGINCAETEMVQQSLDKSIHWTRVDVSNISYDRKNDNRLRAMFIKEKIKSVRRKLKSRRLV